ncbi:hypothetical protein R3P38DRAFT_548171 [Favolaschia claudopus]|uniref:DUF6534 domain-containing protein n=1 Tax=Favolaschia claudopus TaxID=2862362 RepID=A0AAW0CK73_9AGAR
MLSNNALVLLASWLNAALYMLEIVLAVEYFHRPGRLASHKAGVVVLLCSDLACTIAVCAQVYVALIQYPGVDFEAHYADSTMQWEASLTIFSTYITASVEQAFLCYIFYALAKQRLLTGFLVLNIFVHLGFSCTFAVVCALGLLKFRNFGNIGAVTCAATDFLIAIALAVTFHKMELSLPVVPRRRTIQSLIRRMLILSLTSGLLVASFTIIHMVLLAAGSSVSTIFWFCQGRIYTLTLLSNFLLGVPASRANETDPLSIPETTNAPATAETFSLRFRPHGQSEHDLCFNQDPDSVIAAQDKPPGSDK